MMALAALVLAAPLAGPVERTVGERSIPGRTCLSVDVQPVPRASPSASRTWTARKVVDLEILTSLRSARSSRVELRVLTPEGLLYQTLSAPPTRSSSPSRGRTLPKPVAVARLPVAGTQITQRGLYGLWSVVPYLEGGQEPCGPRTSFTLAP